MSWPTKTWTADGWVDFKTPGLGDPEGFPDDWKNYKNTVDNSNYWDVIDNPLYEAAANASGIDWDKWVEDSLAEIGTEEDYEAALDFVNDHRPRSTVTMANGVINPWANAFDTDDRDDAWDDLTETQQQIVNNLPTTSSSSSGGMFGNNNGTGATAIGIAGLGAGDLTGGILGALAGIDEEDTPRDWGFNRSAYGSVAEDLDDMHEWLTKTIKTHSLQDMPIIDRGPQGADYGIDGDIWEHYGLDKPILPPKEMDVNYEFNLAEAHTSNVTYKTPAGYPELDTSTEGVAYEDTHYAKWTEQKREEAKAAHTAAENTSYGETVTATSNSSDNLNARRWESNVQDIIGKNESVDDWAKAAGVDNLNSRSDSDKIKEVYRAAGGVLGAVAGL